MQQMQQRLFNLACPLYMGHCFTMTVFTGYLPVK